MKQMFLAIMAIVVFSFNSAISFAGGSTSESNDFSMPVAQTGKPIQNNISTAKIQETKKATPEEIAAYERDVEKAITRDKDLTAVFTDKFYTGCYYPTRKIDAWLIKNQDVTIDRKEFLAPIEISGGSKNLHLCMTTIVVHYHKITPKEVKKKSKKK